MNLYLISQTVNKGYDTYDSAVVVAESDETAKAIHPDGRKRLPLSIDDYWHDWVEKTDLVTAKLIGIAADGINAGEVVCASFNAG